jgi:cell division protein FtsI (penicillin-binding protein 3)
VRRGALVVLAVILWFGAVGARLWWLQVERHDHFAKKAAQQHQRVLDLEPPRGTIYDARGRVLAVSVDVDTVAANPQEIADPQDTARRIAAALHLHARDARELERRLRAARDGGRDFVFVARKLDQPQADAVRALDLRGIHFVRESKRYYPMRELGAQVLGFVGTDHVGLAGLEAHYDRVVAGRAGRRTVLRDAHRRTLLSPRLAAVEARPGADLHLTFDATVQYIVEKELAAAVARFHAKGGTALVLDPRNGAILGMATLPSFDPNRFAAAPPQRWKVGAVTDAFEPGSTFKMVTAGAVLAHGLLTADDVLDCEQGGITLAGVRIRDHDPYGELTVRQVLAKSSNVGTIKLALLLGQQRLHEQVRTLGFGERTGVDLPGESPGIVRPLRAWSLLSKAYVSFGQEVSVTALQLGRAMAAVANGGRLLRPHVVARVEGEHGVERLDEPFEQGQALTPQVAAQLEELLAEVVRAGTGRQAAIDGYPVAGKTGTAQKVVGGRYSHRYFVSSFVGYAPVGNPRLVGVVALDEPWPVYYGGLVAAPVFSSIARQVLLYWGVPPQPSLGPGPEQTPAPAFDVPPVQLAGTPPRPTLPPPPISLGDADAGEGDALDGPASAAWGEGEVDVASALAAAPTAEAPHEQAPAAGIDGKVRPVPAALPPAAAPPVLAAPALVVPAAGLAPALARDTAPAAVGAAAGENRRDRASTGAGSSGGMH